MDGMELLKLLLLHFPQMQQALHSTSLHPDSVPGPVGTEQFRSSGRPPFHCAQRVSGTFSISIRLKEFVRYIGGKYGGMAVDTVV
jgi:hypothetical protein